MDRFVVSGLGDFDGEYPIDLGRLTMRDLNIIKRISGVLAGQLEDAFKGGDSDLTVALAVIAVRRNGKDWERFERLVWEADVGSIEFVVEPEEVADPEIPTPLPSNSQQEPQPAPFGDGSSDVGDDHQETSLRAIGAQQ